MASFQNCIRLSPSILLEYDRLPPVEPNEEYFDWENDSVTNGLLNGEAVKLFSAHTISLILEYIISGHAGFSQFVELRDILYPDVDLLMYYNSILGDKVTCGWIGGLFDALIKKNEIFLISRSKKAILTETEMYDVKDTVYAVKCELSPLSEVVIDSIAFPELIECGKYRVEIEGVGTMFSEELASDMGIDAAINTAFRIPGIIHHSLEFFSMKPYTNSFQIVVRNNTSNDVVEIDVDPAEDPTIFQYHSFHAVIRDDILSLERRFIQSHKKRGIWPYALIK